jgi:hypothetical protein
MYWLSTIFFSLALPIVTIHSARAAGNWTLGVTPQLLMTQYSGSEERDTMTAYGLFAKADYLDKGGLTLGYNFTSVNGKSQNPDIDEDAWYLSGRLIRYSDLLAGKLGLRLDGYDITDKYKISIATPAVIVRRRRPIPAGTTTATFTDNVSVVYAQLDYTNYGDRFYADIAYAASDYNYDADAELRDNKVQQFTTTASMAFNNRYDLLQTRFYFIHLDHGDNTDGSTSSSAVEFKWLRWYKPNALLNINSSMVKLVTGKRLYPVDPDAAATYSISDVQTSSAAAGLDWKLGEQSKFFLLAGYDQYERPAFNGEPSDKYSTLYLFGSVSLNW